MIKPEHFTAANPREQLENILWRLSNTCVDVIEGKKTLNQLELRIIHSVNDLECLRQWLSPTWEEK